MIHLSDADIFRLHRSGRPSPIINFYKYINHVNQTPIVIDVNDQTKTAEVIIRFTNWSARAAVYDLHYKKNLRLRVRCDLTKFRQGLLDSARTYLRDNELRGFTYNNAECSLLLRDPDVQKPQYYKNYNDFKLAADKLRHDPAFHQRRKPPAAGRGVAAPNP